MVVSAVLAAASFAAAQSLPPTEDGRIRDIIAAVSSERIEDDIRTLVDFGTRHSLSRTDSETFGIGAARRWIKRQFRDRLLRHFSKGETWDERWKAWNRMFPDLAFPSAGAMRHAKSYLEKNSKLGL